MTAARIRNEDEEYDNQLPMESDNYRHLQGFPDITDDDIREVERLIGGSLSRRNEHLLGRIDALGRFRQSTRQYLPYREVHPQPTLDDYYIDTTVRFKSVGSSVPLESVAGNHLADPPSVRKAARDNGNLWQMMKESGSFEFHESPNYLSGSEYLLDRKTGDIYRYSGHWGRVASCEWDIDADDIPYVLYLIGKANIRDFQSHPSIKYQAENPAWEAGYRNALEQTVRNFRALLASGVRLTESMRKQVEQSLEALISETAGSEKTSTNSYNPITDTIIMEKENVEQEKNATQNENFAVVRVPDGNGGHEHKLMPQSEAETLVKTEPFHYVEWSGSRTQILEEANTRLFENHYEPFHGQPSNEAVTLGMLADEANILTEQEGEMIFRQAFDMAMIDARSYLEDAYPDSWISLSDPNKRDTAMSVTIDFQDTRVAPVFQFMPVEARRFAFVPRDVVSNDALADSFKGLVNEWATDNPDKVKMVSTPIYDSDLVFLDFRDALMFEQMAQFENSTDIALGIKDGRPFHNGDLVLEGGGLVVIPDNLHVGGDLDIRDSSINHLPHGLKVEGNLLYDKKSVRNLPRDIQVNGSIELADGHVIGENPFGFIDLDKSGLPLEPKHVPTPDVSPLMQQYAVFKKTYPNVAPFYHIGDGYETYQEDARRVAGLLGVTVTRNESQRDVQGNAAEAVVLSQRDFMGLLALKVPFAVLEDANRGKNIDPSEGSDQTKGLGREQSQEQADEQRRGSGIRR